MQQLFDPSQPGVGCQYTHPGEWRFMLCTPLLFQEEIIGALQLRGAPGENLPDSQSIEHIRNLSIIFSSHLSAMAANLKLNATLEKERLYDSTGLFNSGYIGDLLGVEMHRAARFKRPISVMMIGVNINRSLLSNPEQATVESILITTAHFLRAQVRREDPLFRYNEQQFIFVLPEAEIPDAFNRAEVLRMGTKNIRILDRNTYIKPVTISIGISGYPTHGSDIEEILQAARLALEEAEISGGDRVCHAK
jgi:diguanylate cyclase (GGDEF)-like protein